jgi:hypothetical protein
MEFGNEGFIKRGVAASLCRRTPNFLFSFPSSCFALPSRYTNICLQLGMHGIQFHGDNNGRIGGQPERS